MAVLLVARATLLFIYRRRRLLSHPSVSAIGRKVKVAAAARKVGAAAGYATHGAFRGVAIACGALSIVAGAAFFWTRRGAAFVKYMSSPATPAAPLHKRHRADGQMAEWRGDRSRRNRENKLLTRSF